MSTRSLQSWLFRVEPLPEESFSHFLGRFRRANQLSHQTLAELLTNLEQRSDREASANRKCDSPTERLRQRSLIQAWETVSRRQRPTARDLEHLAQLTQLDVAQLQERLLPSEARLHLATRLCSRCYQAEPIHRCGWQLMDRSICLDHGTPLLTECPACQTAFRLPSLWAVGCCERCWLPFEQMGDDHN